MQHPDTTHDPARPTSAADAAGHGGTRPGASDDRPPVGEPLVAPRRSRRRHTADVGALNGDGEVGDDAGDGAPPDGRAGSPPAPEPIPEPPAPPPFQGRGVLVTGATSELGAAFATAFADLGAELHLLDGDLDALRELAAGLPAGTRSLVLCCDLGSVDEIRSVGEFLERAEAAPDVVVHAAAVTEAGTALGSPIEGLDEHYLIGVRGPTVLLQAVVPSLAPGAVVVFADRVDDDDPDDAHRAVVDGARRRLVDALRGELEAHDVTVMSARASGDTPLDQVVAGVVGALVAERAAEVVEVSLRPRREAPEG